MRVPDEIQKDLRAPEGRVHPVDTMWFSVSARPRRRGRQGGQDLPEPPRYLDFAPTNGESAD